MFSNDDTFISLIYINESIDDVPFLDELLWFQ